MAEAFFGMPNSLIAACKYHLKPDMLEVVERFERLTK